MGNLLGIFKLILWFLREFVRNHEVKKQEELENETNDNPRSVFKREFMRDSGAEDLSKNSKTKL